jgi:hypothetical protein
VKSKQSYPEQGEKAKMKKEKNEEEKGDIRVYVRSNRVTWRSSEKFNSILRNIYQVSLVSI